MRNHRLANQYHHLTHRERLRLLITAQVRDDKAEERRLWDSCPRWQYYQTDVDFFVPQEAVVHAVMYFAVEMARLLGRLEMLAEFRLMVPRITSFAADEAADAELMELLDRVVPQEVETASAETPSSPAADEADEPPPEANPDPHDLPLTKQMTDRLFDGLHQMYARESAGLLAGLDRFAKRLLDLDAQTLLQAYRPDVQARIEHLGIHEAEPDEASARQIESLMWEVWQRRTGWEAD